MKINRRKTTKETVLITGSTGFVGANLTRKLTDQGYRVHALVRKTSNKWRLKDVLPKINLHTVDLLDFPKLKKEVKKIKPGIIFHLATAGIYGGRQFAESKVFKTNFTGTFNLLQSCKDIDYKCFVNTGSSSEYGPKLKKMSEEDMCLPINSYGVSKLLATLYCSKIAKFEKKPIVTFRLFSPFGPYDHHLRLISYVVVNALQNKPLKLANPASARDYIYIDNVVELYIKSINKARKYRGEVFNVGSGKQARISTVVDSIVKLTGCSSVLKWNSISQRSFDTKRWQADISKVSKCFNWQPRFSLESGLEETVHWFRNNLSVYKKLLKNEK